MTNPRFYQIDCISLQVPCTMGSFGENDWLRPSTHRQVDNIYYWVEGDERIKFNYNILDLSHDGINFTINKSGLISFRAISW